MVSIFSWVVHAAMKVTSIKESRVKIRVKLLQIILNIRLMCPLFLGLLEKMNSKDCEGNLS